MKITFALDESFDVDYILNMVKLYPTLDFLIEVQNTSGIKSTDIQKLPQQVVGIRIAGGYNEERINNYKNYMFGNETCKEFLYDSVIYSKNETINILRKMEEIEKGINPNWSDLQKIIYIHDVLKRTIMYDPKFKEKGTKETSTLRGLLTRKGVCAGYSTTFKEMLDRQGITCHIVFSKDHAWNIFKLDDKYYPLDLTWNNTNFRKGDFNSHSFFANDVEQFNRQHVVENLDPLYGKYPELHFLDPNLINTISSQMVRDNEYESSTYKGRRKDGSMYLVSQVGKATINGRDYFRYYYADLNQNSKEENPVILYSQMNLNNFINSVLFKKNKGREKEYENVNYVLNNILFSRENIIDSLKNGTYYIGGVTRKNNSNKKEVVSEVSQIDKPKDVCNIFTYRTKRYVRSDGSKILVQKMNKNNQTINGQDVNTYHIFELIENDNNDKPLLKRNIVYTDSDLFNDQRKELADIFLSRERLDTIAQQTGGYLGKFNIHGGIDYNEKLAEFYDISKSIEVDGKIKKAITPLPTFDELKDLVHNYEIVIDAKYMANPNSIPIVCDKRTKEQVTEKHLINKVIMANLWLTSAGTRHFANENIPGETYAFSDNTRRIYELICDGMTKTAKRKGAIDTVAIFGNIDKFTNYSDTHSIVANFFKTPMQVNLFNQMTLDSLGIDSQDIEPVPLYSVEYAGYLANDRQSTRKSS